MLQKCLESSWNRPTSQTETRTKHSAAQEGQTAAATTAKQSMQMQTPSKRNQPAKQGANKVDRLGTQKQARAKQTDKQDRPEFNWNNYPHRKPHPPLWNVGPRAHREPGDDACKGFKKLLTMGGAHAPSWVRTIGRTDFPRWEPLQREKCAHQLACNVCIKIKNPSSGRAHDQKLQGVGRLETPSPT